MRIAAAFIPGQRRTSFSADISEPVILLKFPGLDFPYSSRPHQLDDEFVLDRHGCSHTYGSAAVPVVFRYRLVPSRSVFRVAGGDRFQRHGRLSPSIFTHDFPGETTGASVHSHLWLRCV